MCTGLSMSVNAAITSTDAINYAKAYINATTYMWEDTVSEKQYKVAMNDSNATYYPNLELVITMNGINLPIIPANFKLAFKVDIYSKVPYDAKSVYVDASTGSIIKDNALIFSCNPVNGQSLFPSVTRNFSISNGNTYENACLGGGIRTNYNAFTASASNINYSYNNYTFNQVHWGTEQYYKFLLQKFNRHSIDNADKNLQSIIRDNQNISVAPNAAYSNGTVSFYKGSGFPTGDIFCTNDIIGHEWGHGVSDYIIPGNNISSGEPGGIGEGISDVFGTYFTLCLGDSIELGRPQEVGLECLWYTPDNATPFAATSNFKFNASAPGIFTYIQKMDNCVVSFDTVSVTVVDDCLPISIPNTFTPNEDGVNDEWRIELKSVSNVSYTIYNRWGNMIKGSPVNSHSFISWDGRTTSGEETTQGIYFYVLEYTTRTGDKKKLNGYISLFR